jgi:tetratricopeptide (TPR) repeat protein
MMKPASLFFIFLLAAGSLLAQDEQVAFAKANKAYTVGSYSVAADQYQKIVASGFESPGLYYNLGNAYFKMNDYARAILWYERAKRLDPGNEDIDFNLNVANTKISDKIESLPELFYKRWFRALVETFSSDTWAFLGVGAFIATLLGFVLYLASQYLILRKIGFWAASAMLALSLFTLIFAWSSHHFELATSEAIVFAPTITVKSSPDEKSTDLFVLHEGTKVSLLDKISGWYEIRIANGSVGWLPKSSLEEI